MAIYFLFYFWNRLSIVLPCLLELPMQFYVAQAGPVVGLKTFATTPDFQVLI